MISAWNFFVYTMTSPLVWGLAFGVLLIWIANKMRGHDVTINTFLLVFLCLSSGSGAACAALLIAQLSGVAVI